MSNTVLSIARYSVCQTLVLQSNAHMPETTVDVDALYAALDNKRKVHGTSWREIAAAARRQPVDLQPHGRANALMSKIFRDAVALVGTPVESFMRGRRPPAATEEARGDGAQPVTTLGTKRLRRGR